MIKSNFPRRFAYSISGNLSNNLGKMVNQQGLSRFDAAVINLYPPEDILYNGKTWQQVIQEIRELNPNILLGNYTLLEETKNDADSATNTDIDKYEKVEGENWWLRDDMGQKINSYGQSCLINGSGYTNPDSQRMRYPDWLAQRDFDKFFDPALTSGKGFEIWFLDNVRDKPSHDGDWNEDGENDLRTSEVAISSYREMVEHYVNDARELKDCSIIMGNAPNDLSMYPKLLNASLNEALMGESWSPGGYPPWGEGHDGDWGAMMGRYAAHFDNVKDRFVVFNVRGAATDYALFRFGLCSCLLNDGFYSYTDWSAGYVVPPWFDEYNYDLGVTLGPAPKSAWQSEVWRRDFQNGISLVNPSFIDQIVNIECCFGRLEGEQDPAINNGEIVGDQITIPARDGLVLRRLQ